MNPVLGWISQQESFFLKTLEKLAKIKTQLIYVTHHIDEILPLTTHVMFLKSGTIFSQGPKNKMLTGSHLSVAFDCHIECREKNQADTGLLKVGQVNLWALLNIRTKYPLLSYLSPKNNVQSIPNS